LRVSTKSKSEAHRRKANLRNPRWLRGTVNVLGNGLATVVVSRWEKELDREALRNKLA
jgi:hypothetical protein